MEAVDHGRRAVQPWAVDHAVYLDGLPNVELAHIVLALRAAGARFAFLHGSRVHGAPRSGSDLDVAAWFGRRDVEPWAVELPDLVDLGALDLLPLAVAGRIALHGVLLFDDDPPARVRWQADTRLRYVDESWLRAAVTRDFLARPHRG